MTFVELHGSSAFSFLEGASLPEDLADAAASLGLPAMALVDVRGVYGAPRFYKAAKACGLRPLVGAELPMDDGSRLTLLVESRAGYQRLCRLLTQAALGKPKGQARLSWSELAARELSGLHALSGGDEGAAARAWAASPGDSRPAERALLRLRELFEGRVHLELQRHGRRDQEHRNRAFIELARELGLPLVASNAPLYAREKSSELCDALWCAREKTTLDAAGRRLLPNRERRLKGPREMRELFADLPEAVEETLRLAQRLTFTLDDLGYRFPDFPLPPGETAASRLRTLTWEGAAKRFRPPTDKARAQLEKELALIEKLDLAGYFLIVWDIVRFCRENKILAQGRGSAANSAVCYALEITAVDPVRMDLLFERFLSEERGEWPDIDLDLPSGDQRERVIQYLYARYGAQSAAMTANVITYRPKLAVREAAKALGYSAEQVDKLSGALGPLTREELKEDPGLVGKGLRAAGLDPAQKRTQKLVATWLGLQDLPRHLGQHSGGMVLAGGRLDEIVPLEPASMPGRVVIQWDKDDCADLGLIKVDLLGLGMLAVLEEAVPTVKRCEGVDVELAQLPADDPKVFAMLNAADTVGVFQLESRAQMASLPRHAPKTFYDLVVQVAIIRPGPIVGGMIRPFFERRQGRAPVEYPHPSLEPVLKRTLGVPLFQEQVLRMAMVAAGFSGGQAEELRRAMGFKRSAERMEAIVSSLRAGMRGRGLSDKAQEEVVRMITSFALYGFPESHAASFALIAYASAYLKAHHPAAFYCALLNAWPMGFYHPATLVKDAQRRGVDVRCVDASRSGWDCAWEEGGVRLGLRCIRGLRERAGRAIERERAGRPFAGTRDLALRCGLEEHELEQLADAGALSCFGLSRRAALWQAAHAARSEGPLFDRAALEAESPLQEMSPREETLADYRTQALTTGAHILAHHRAALARFGVRTAAELSALPDGAAARAAGLVIVRQRPGTAKGFVFLTLEDETGMVQAIVGPRLFAQCRGIIGASAGLVVEGVLQKQEGVLSLKARRFWPLNSPAASPSRDFH